MPYQRAETIAIFATPTMRILQTWLRAAMDKTLEGRRDSLHDALSNTLPSVVEQMQAVIARIDSTVKEKLEAANIIRQLNGRVVDKEINERLTEAKKAAIAIRRERGKAVDKRAKVAEQRRISKALSDTVKEIKEGGV